jgi:hypothetical protein
VKTMLLFALCFCCSCVCTRNNDDQLTRGSVTVCAEGKAEHLRRALNELSVESPLPYDVTVQLVGRGVTAWGVSKLPENARLVYIMSWWPEDEQVRALRHEWKHFVQEAEKHPYEGEEAEKEARSFEE